MQNGLETLKIDGIECVVIHISVDNRIGTAICTGNKFTIPGANDTRPKTLCNDCRNIFVKDKR